MSHKSNHTFVLRDQLIAGLTRENELQEKYLKELRNLERIIKKLTKEVASAHSETASVREQ